MIYIKVHQSYRKVVAVCDEELVGKNFEEGQMQLEVKESFFKGELVNEEEAIVLLRKHRADDSTFNIVGDKSVEAASRAGIVSKKNVGGIGGIAFALVLL